MNMSKITPVFAVLAFISSNAGAIQDIQSDPEKVAAQLDLNQAHADALKSADNLQLAMRCNPCTFETGSTF